jgi:formylglycine-generating enzyme required for sulfatase activity
LAAVVAKTMARTPADRYQTPAEVLSALAPFCEPDLRPAPRVQKQVRRWPLIAAGLALLAGVTAAGVIIIVRDQQGNKSAQIEIPAGGSVKVTPPVGGSVEVIDNGTKSSAMRVDPRADEAQGALRTLLAKAKDPASKSEKLRDEVIDFCLKYRGTPASCQAGLLLPEMPPLTNSVGMKLAPIPPGKFQMGSLPGEPGRNKDGREGPRHEVEITRPFFMGVHEVTVGQFRGFVKATGHKTDAEKKGGAERLYPNGQWRHDARASWQNPGFEQTDAHPVVCIRWNDAQAFCAWLSKKEGRTYRLPTEAEWEYACRAGTTTHFYSGNDDRDLKGVANVADASLTRRVPNAGRCVSWDDGFPFTAPVGSFRPNAFGLYDMHGNAWEWCHDWFGRDYYQITPRQDPPGPNRSGVHVLRGGAWFDSINNCRAADRHYNLVSSSCHANMGFRVVLLPAGPQAAPAGSPEPEAFLGSNPLEHANRVTCCRFSPDGKVLATGGKDGVVKLWDGLTGKELRTLSQREPVGNIVFSPDGRTLASWSKRGVPAGKPLEWKVKFWNVDTGKELPGWPGFPELLGPVAFSPDGKIVATGGPNHAIKLWDFSTRKERGSLTGHTGDLTCLAFSPDGKQLASGSDACVMKLWNLSDQREVLSLREEGQKASWCPWIHSTVFSQDGKYLVVGMGAYLLVYDLSSSKLRWKLRKHIWATVSVVLSTDDRYVLSAGSAGDGVHFVISELATGDSIRSVPAWRAYRDGYRGAEAIALSPDGSILASAGPDHTVKIWDTESWRELEAQPASPLPAK